MSHYDVVIVGAGMAGAGVAAAIAEQAPALSVLILEAEDQPGFHATGRSAAFWHESYGGPLVRPLSDASFADLEAAGVLSPRGALTIGRARDAAAVERFVATFAAVGVDARLVDGDAMARAVPGIRQDWTIAAAEDRCRDIDVAALHANALGAARRGGATVATRAALVEATWSAGRSTVTIAGGQTVSAGAIVNAAGAWADDVARRCGVTPSGIRAYRRTVVQLRLARDIPATLPLVIDINGGFYFKPVGAGRIWLSPHDETAVDPGDAAPEELDVATAIARLQEVVDWPLAAVERRWAGLRSFAPDRLPVIGPAVDVPGFIWCAGQGGFGIQTAPAVSALCASTVTGVSPGRALEGLADGRYGPARLAARATTSAASDAS